MDKWPEMAGLVKETHETVSKPDEIRQAAHHQDRRVYYRQWPEVGWLCVVVTYPKRGKKGWLFSAYPLPKPKDSEAVLWRRP